MEPVLLTQAVADVTRRPRSNELWWNESQCMPPEAVTTVVVGLPQMRELPSSDRKCS